MVAHADYQSICVTKASQNFISLFIYLPCCNHLLAETENWSHDKPGSNIPGAK